MSVTEYSGEMRTPDPFRDRGWGKCWCRRLLGGRVMTRPPTGPSAIDQTSALEVPQVQQEEQLQLAPATASSSLSPIAPSGRGGREMT